MGQGDAIGGAGPVGCVPASRPGGSPHAPTIMLAERAGAPTLGEAAPTRSTGANEPATALSQAVPPSR
jgi:hypothetical protein